MEIVKESWGFFYPFFSISSVFRTDFLAIVSYSLETETLTTERAGAHLGLFLGRGYNFLEGNLTGPIAPF